MADVGQGRGALVAAAAVALSVVACVIVWPFTIDDALISVRYARHIAGGAGYVWNVGGPSTDGVTPLPWAFVLAPLAHAPAVLVLERAKLLGAVVWLLGAAVWGRAVGRAYAPAWVTVAALALLAVDLPVAAHAVSGMETALAMTLATIASTQHARPRRAALFAGVAATLRPELVVWAVVIAAGFALGIGPGRGASVPRACLDEPESVRRRGVLASVALASGPFVLVALTRLCVFGRLTPLSVLAKPSDLAHGTAYVGAAAVFTLAPLVLAAPIALARERGPALAIAAAGAAHFAVVLALGGDWMPFARLVAPVVPSMLYGFVLVARRPPAWLVGARVLAALAVAAWLVPRNVQSLRSAGAARASLIDAARPVLGPVRSLAAVDIGWPSAVSEATIVDLSGVTDPDVAVLHGGHTSKRVDVGMLLARDPEVVLVFTTRLPTDGRVVDLADLPHVVAARLVTSDVFLRKYEPTGTLALGTAGAGYVVFTESTADRPPPP